MNRNKRTNENCLRSGTTGGWSEPKVDDTEDNDTVSQRGFLANGETKTSGVSRGSMFTNTKNECSIVNTPPTQTSTEFPEGVVLDI